jgi:hypothetical protein
MVSSLKSVLPFMAGVSVPQISLPIGISFYVFQSMSYIIDVYREDAPVQKNGVYQVRVPRQEDNSLEMVMLDDDDIVDRLPLGEYIARSGYDWTAENLADVNVALDLEMQQVMISVSGWDGVVVMDIVI